MIDRLTDQSLAQELTNKELIEEVGILTRQQ